MKPIINAAPFKVKVFGWCDIIRSAYQRAHKSPFVPTKVCIFFRHMYHLNIRPTKNLHDMTHFDIHFNTCSMLAGSVVVRRMDIVHWHFVHSFHVVSHYVKIIFVFVGGPNILFCTRIYKHRANKRRNSDRCKRTIRDTRHETRAHLNSLSVIELIVMGMQHRPTLLLCLCNLS